ncbi:MAG TPA: DUF1697 domain-containing protein [Vicinamibacterales bacterium]|jgi:uncharacterized protein (DUF1697 family)
MRYVAFLRAINVGGHVVKMDRLRTLFEKMKFKGVQTFIASGNVIFETAARDTATIERRIERELAAAFGYDVEAFVRSIDEVAAVAGHEPFGPAGVRAGQKLSVVFLRSSPDAAFKKTIDGLRVDSDDFHFHQRELYWLCRGGMMSQSPVAVPLGKALGVRGTMRNVTTVRKLAAKCSRS